MSADACRRVIAASARDRLDLFLTAANLLGAPVGNAEKDFWVCWTLDTLYHHLPEPLSPMCVCFRGEEVHASVNLLLSWDYDEHWIYRSPNTPIPHPVAAPLRAPPTVSHRRCGGSCG